MKKKKVTVKEVEANVFEVTKANDQTNYLPHSLLTKRELDSLCKNQKWLVTITK